MKVWGEFMVYAYLFGVADQAIKQLQTTMPQLFEYDGSMGMDVHALVVLVHGRPYGCRLSDAFG